MKKAINKTEREHIIVELVAAASTKSAQAIVDKLGVLRKELFTMLHNQWQDNFPGITRVDQELLLQSRGAVSLSFQPSIYGKDPDSESKKQIGTFGQLSWRNEGTDNEKARRSVIAGRIFGNCTGVSGVVTDGITTSWQASLNIGTAYPSIIAGNQPRNLYDASTQVPETYDPIYNDLLLAKHVKIMALLNELRELVTSAEEAHATLSAALAPVKTAQALAELMPEAVKFFPASLTYVKPTKEIADPQAINEIRAKLKAGLPV